MFVFSDPFTVVDSKNDSEFLMSMSQMTFLFWYWELNLEVGRFWTSIPFPSQIFPGPNIIL